MPGSFGVLDDVVKVLIEKINPQTVLDIGTGAGKYGRMVKEACPKARRTGIEVEPKYVKEFKLKKLYHDLRIMDAMDITKRGHDESFDLVIIGDCIEHLPKSSGLDLLNFLTYRTQYTIVLAPEFCVQGTVNGVDSESHVSVWSEADFQWHDAWAFENALTISLFVLRGYLAAPISIPKLVHEVNEEAPDVMDFNRERYIRKAHLSLNIRGRAEVIDGRERNFRKW